MSFKHADNLADDSNTNDGVKEALLKVSMLRFERFRSRFGRDPKVHESLLFDPNCDWPVPASRAERKMQITTAAFAVGEDPKPILRWMGLED